LLVLHSLRFKVNRDWQAFLRRCYFPVLTNVLCMILLPRKFSLLLSLHVVTLSATCSTEM